MIRRTVRNEWKYQISPASAVLLARRLAVFLKRDMHSRLDGYLIRSLYFDDIAESAFFDKLAGVNERAKYRLRYYDNDTERIFLECKRKHGYLTEKDSVQVSRTTAEHMMRNMPLAMDELSAPLMAEFAAQRSARLMRPRVIVDYQRLAFVYDEQDTRITLDSNIRTNMYRTDALFDRITTMPVLENGNVILEVKFDEYLPERAKEALSHIAVMPQANSKFCQCVLPLI